MPTKLPIFIVDASSILTYIHTHPLLLKNTINIENPTIYIFCKTLIKLSKKFNIAHIVVIWGDDKDIKNFTEYQSDRKIIIDFINSIKMEQITEKKIPTVDLIYSIFRSFQHQHHHVVVITTDSKLYSCINDTAAIVNPWKKNIKIPTNIESIPSRHPNPTTTARTIFHEKNWQRALPFLQKLNYKKLISLVKIKPIPKHSLQSLINENYKHSFKLAIITSQDTLIQLCDDIKKSKILCLSLEGSHTDPMISSCLSVSIATDESTVHYISLQTNHNEKGITLSNFVTCLQSIFADENIEKVMQHATFNQILCKRLGMPLHGIIFDTNIAVSLLIHKPQESNLNFLENFYTKNANLSYQELTIQHVSLEPKTFIHEKSWNSIANTHQTIMLKKIICLELEKQGMINLYKTIEMPVNTILAKMEYEGVYCQIKILEEIDLLVTKKLHSLTKEINAYSPTPINLNSTAQVRKLLFETLKLPVLKKLHTSKKLHKPRKISTDTETLIELSKFHPIAKLILQYRKLFKLKKTYVENLPQYINSQTNKIHPFWHQILTTTDRITSSHPNLQNIPTEDKGLGIFIRSAFQAQNNNVFIGAAYNDIELHIIAYLSKDKALKNALDLKHDIHATTAAYIFSTTAEKITSLQRSIAKKINLSISYGLTAYGLARDQHISITEARYAIQKFFDQYPSVQEWIQSTLIVAQKKLYIQTLHGKIRYIPNLNSVNRVKFDTACRLAINSIVQGSATEIMKIAMINIDKMLNINNLEAQIIINIHDQLIISASKLHLNVIKNNIQESMESAASKDYSLSISMLTGHSWHDITKE